MLWIVVSASLAQDEFRISDQLTPENPAEESLYRRLSVVEKQPIEGGGTMVGSVQKLLEVSDIVVVSRFVGNRSLEMAGPRSEEDSRPYRLPYAEFAVDRTLKGSPVGPLKVRGVGNVYPGQTALLFLSGPDDNGTYMPTVRTEYGSAIQFDASGYARAAASGTPYVRLHDIGKIEVFPQPAMSASDLAEGARSGFVIDPNQPPTWEEIVEVQARYTGPRHPFSVPPATLEDFLSLNLISESDPLSP